MPCFCESATKNARGHEVGREGGRTIVARAEQAGPGARIGISWRARRRPVAAAFSPHRVFWLTPDRDGDWRDVLETSCAG